MLNIYFTFDLLERKLNNKIETKKEKDEEKYMINCKLSPEEARYRINIIRTKKYYNQKVCDMVYLYMTSRYEQEQMKREKLFNNMKERLVIEENVKNTDYSLYLQKQFEKQIEKQRNPSNSNWEDKIKKKYGNQMNFYSKILKVVK